MRMGHAVLHDTRAGLRINANCQVMDMNGQAIPDFIAAAKPADLASTPGAPPARGTSRTSSDRGIKLSLDQVADGGPGRDAVADDFDNGEDRDARMAPGTPTSNTKRSTR